MKLKSNNRPRFRLRSKPPGTSSRTRSSSRSTADAQKLAVLAAQAGLDKKAANVEIIDVSGKVDYADYLVLMTGQSDRHVSAIARGVDEELAKAGAAALSLEGLPQAQWVLIDFVDVVVHVFLDDARSLYNLDGLWMDAKRIPVPSQRDTLEREPASLHAEIER